MISGTASAATVMCMDARNSGRANVILYVQVVKIKPDIMIEIINKNIKYSNRI